MAKIDVSAIAGYAEMTPEQKIAALEAYEYEDNAAEVERLKNAVTKANKESAERKQKLSDLQTEEQRKQQAQEEELQKLREEVETARKERTIAGYKASLLANGYEEALANESAQALFDGDTAKFFANQKKAREAQEKEIKKQLLGGNDAPPAGGIGNTEADFGKAIEEAQDRGDFVSVAYYTRLQEEQRIKQETK